MSKKVNYTMANLEELFETTNHNVVTVEEFFALDNHTVVSVEEYLEIVDKETMKRTQKVAKALTKYLKSNKVTAAKVRSLNV